MAYKIRDATDMIRDYSGSQYNPIGGVARLKIRTGTGQNDILEYGFTTDVSASQYCPAKTKIKEGVTAYIGRVQTREVTKEVTNTQESYVTRIAEKTNTTQKTVTRTTGTSNHTSQSPVTSTRLFSTKQTRATLAGSTIATAGASYSFGYSDAFLTSSRTYGATSSTLRTTTHYASRYTKLEVYWTYMTEVLFTTEEKYTKSYNTVTYTTSPLTATGTSQETYTYKETLTENETVTKKDTITSTETIDNFNI